MSPPEIPLFDLLTRQPLPHEGLGDVLPFSQTCEDRFREIVQEARSRAREVFDSVIGEDRESVYTLEALIEEIWGQGWTPQSANVDLFATDFGSLLTSCLSEELGGQLVFRSETDLSHLSCWWRLSQIEAFPFHKVYKRLVVREGESLSFYFSALERMLRSGVNTSTDHESS